MDIDNLAAYFKQHAAKQPSPKPKVSRAKTPSPKTKVSLAKTPSPKPRVTWAQPEVIVIDAEPKLEGVSYSVEELERMGIGPRAPTTAEYKRLTASSKQGEKKRKGGRKGKGGKKKDRKQDGTMDEKGDNGSGLGSGGTKRKRAARAACYSIRKRF